MKKYLLSKGIKTANVMLAASVVLLLQSCLIYKVQTFNPITKQSIEAYNSQQKYFILHQGTAVWHLTDINLNEYGITGRLEVLPDNRYQFQTPEQTKAHKYKRASGSVVLDQVHIYLDNSHTPLKESDGPVTISYTGMQKAETYQKAPGRSIASWVVPIGSTIGGAILVFYLLTDPFQRNVSWTIKL